MFHKIFLAVSLPMMFCSLVGATYQADMYEQKSNKSNKLFVLNVATEVKDGIEIATANFTDPQGALAVKEVAEVKGSELVRTSIDQLQTKQKGLIEVKEGKVFFTLTNSDGSSSVKTENLGKSLVIPANFQKYVFNNWKELAAGKTLSFRYGVWFRQETVGFELFKIATEKINDEEVIVFKMKPSSFIIAALVDPVIFKFKSDGSRLLMMNGRVAPKRNVDGKWKDLDAEVWYTYPSGS